MKLKEYATKIKNRLTGKNTKPQKEEKDDLSEQILERTQEMIKEDRQEAVRAAVVEEPEEITDPEPKTEERNIGADVIKLAVITKGLTIDPEWSKDDMIKAISEHGGLPENEIEVLLASTAKWMQDISKSMTEAFEKIKPAIIKAGEEMKKAITAALAKTKWTSFQLRKELFSNNRRKMKGMPMIRAKAIEKARKNARRKPKK